MNIIKYRKFWYSISGVFFVLSFIFLGVFGLKQGIDFTGGSLLAVRYEGQQPTAVEAEQVLSDLNLGSVVIQPVGDKDMHFRMKSLDENMHQEVLTALRTKYKITELRFDSIGPVIGKELKSRSIIALIIVFLSIMVYVAWAFRRVSVPVKSWRYGAITVLAAIHDVIIPVGFFVLFGKLFGTEIGTPFIAAILTIMGYSINDTIVVFDRIRENLQTTSGTFKDIVNNSLNQTLSRSLNTTVTTLLALLAVYLFGGDSIKDFALTLIIGILAGTYSSIFIASPLLYTVYRFSRRNKK